MSIRGPELALELGVRWWEGTPQELSPDLRRHVPYSFVQRHQVLPVHQEGESIWVAMSEVRRVAALEELSFFLSYPLEPVLCEASLLTRKIEESYRTGAAADLLRDSRSSEESEEDPRDVDLLEDEGDSVLVRFLNALLSEAIQQRVSDIHFDPMEQELRIRYRIDSILYERHVATREMVSPLVTRLKVMARLDIAEHRLPQDGRMRVRVAGRESDFRVSTIPCLGGERIVLRLLDKTNVSLGLQYLGMPSEVLTGLRRCLHRSEGMILVTGPTGSGKTTTLYSAVRDLLHAERNIMTIEDPIEVRIPGIAQIQVQPKVGFSFASGLRHILRQDPDIILVGEIRDQETASIAIQAALTGHLVLSTLHTNDAPSAIARLIEMGVEPYLLSSAILGVMAQRLVRHLCPACKESKAFDAHQLQEWGIDPSQALPSFASKGCSACQQQGFQGRRGLYEWLPMTPLLESSVLTIHDAGRLRALAKQEGFISLRRHGLDLCHEGITTLSELARVTSPEA